MCKVLIFTDLSKVKNIKKLANVSAKHLLETESDGFGYAVQGESGVFGERTIRENFYSRLGKSELFVKLPIFDKTYNAFGKQGTVIGGGMFHGRTSTNNVNLTNTHPIRRNGWTLIHNGVVTNKGPDYVKKTTNDTEDLVHYMSTTGIKGIEDHLSGYYAFGALDPEGNMHVVKDSVANLYVALIKQIGSLVFGTTEEIIEDVMNEMKWTIGPIERVKDDVHMIFKMNGELIHNEAIKPRGYERAESIYASKSLGTSLHNWNDKYDYSGYDGNVSTSMTKDDKYIEHSYTNYFLELEEMDGSYTVFNMKGERIELSEFRSLSEYNKLQCTVVRGDGTVVDAEDYDTKKLYQGRTG